VLIRHTDDCRGIDSKGQKTVMPQPDKNILKFTNLQHTMRVPYIIYADCETLNKPTGQCSGQLTEQLPISYCYYVVRCDWESRGPFNLYVREYGDSLVDSFMDALNNEVKTIKEELKVIAAMDITDDEQTEWENTDTCWICKKSIGDKVKVRDHDHITGKYRGAAHDGCNLLLRIKPEEFHIPVVFHNLRWSSHNSWV